MSNKMSEEETSLNILHKCLNLFRGKSNENVRETIEDLIEEAQGNGDNDFSEHEQLLLGNILSLKSKKGFNAMVPRADIIAFPKSGTIKDLAELMITVGHSRIPVYGESLDDIVSVVHILDLAKHLLKGEFDTKVEDIAHRPAKFISPTTGVLELLREMQSSKVHLAMIIDEYGGVNGLVTIEDLLEEIVGDIEDEYDFEEDPYIMMQGKNKILVDAEAELDDIKEATGLDLTEDYSQNGMELDTIGGYVFHIAKRVPNKGETISGKNGIKYRILDSDPRRIKKIMIVLPRTYE